MFTNKKPVSACCGASLRRTKKDGRELHCTKCKQRYRLKEWWAVPGGRIDEEKGKETT